MKFLIILTVVLTVVSAQYESIFDPELAPNQDFTDPVVENIALLKKEPQVPFRESDVLVKEESEPPIDDVAIAQKETQKPSVEFLPPIKSETFMSSSERPFVRPQVSSPLPTNLYVPNLLYTTRAPALSSTTLRQPTYNKIVNTASAADQSAKFVREYNEINPNGEYHHGFETDTGIFNEAQGSLRTIPGNPPSSDIVVKGSFAWQAPNGELVAVRYIADENGYQPESDAIPTPPPVPPQIARAVEWLKQVFGSKPKTAN